MQIKCEQICSLCYLFFPAPCNTWNCSILKPQLIPVACYEPLVWVYSDGPSLCLAPPQGSASQSDGPHCSSIIIWNLKWLNTVEESSWVTHQVQTYSHGNNSLTITHALISSCNMIVIYSMWGFLSNCFGSCSWSRIMSQVCGMWLGILESSSLSTVLASSPFAGPISSVGFNP